MQELYSVLLASCEHNEPEVCPIDWPLHHSSMAGVLQNTDFMTMKLFDLLAIYPDSSNARQPAHKQNMLVRNFDGPG